MAETVTGTTVGDVKYVVAYFDVNTNNLYDVNGTLYGNNTLATFLDNEFTLELHYVQDTSTSSNPEEWAVWDGLKDLTVSSTLAFDDNYLHAVKGTVVADTAAGSPSVSVDVTDEINKDTLSRYGVLLVNPFGDEEDQLMIPYSSFQQVSGTTFSFIVDDAQGLEASVTKDSPVRVSDPLYMFINANDIYEANIPNRYEEGVFKFPVNVMSRKLLNALDYSGSTGVSGTMEHKIYANKTNVVGLKNKSFTPPMPLDRNQDIDEVASLREFVGIKTTIGGDTVYPRDASHDRTNDGTDYYAWMNTENDTVAFYTKTTNVTVGTLLYDELYFTQLDETVSALVYEVNPYLFCGWNSGILKYWTKGNDVKENDYFYNISGGTATVGTASASPVYEAEPVLFRTFAFPFIVRNLVDYGVSLTIPTEDIDWTKEYIISIIRNNMEEVTGKASQGAYGVVLIGSNIDVADGVISVKDASTSDKGVIQIATSEEVTAGTETSKAVVPSTLAVELAKKQDNLSNGNVTTLNTTSGAKIDVNVGDGLDVGVAGSTNANKLIVNEASVKEVLEDVVDDGTEPAVNEIVTADNLRGALSVGQAVDVSCEPSVTSGTLTWDSDYLGTGTWSGTSLGTEQGIGFLSSPSSPFPKYADNLKYLYILDVTTNVALSYLKTYATDVNGFTGAKDAGWSGRVAILASTKYFAMILGVANGTSYSITVSNVRQYEVTVLTDEAIAYIAQLPDPDAFFRSTSAYSIRDKYLIKQDMVCPFIPTIEMSNSDLTVASGLSYKMTYKSNTATTHIITADTIPTLAYGWDTHLQLFVDDKTTVNFQSPLILQDPLIPNAGHNMTIKWRNGQALAYVDDTDVGYIVTVTAGTDNGSLYYGLTNDVGEYITFANTTDSTPIQMETAILQRNVNILGNGADKTIITYSGSTNGIRMINNRIVNINNVSFRDGVLGEAATIDCSYNSVLTITNTLFDNITSEGTCAGIYGGSGLTKFTISGCTFSNMVQTKSTDAPGSAIKCIISTQIVTVENCEFTNCRRAVCFNSATTIKDCKFNTSVDGIVAYTGSTVTFAGTNLINSTISGTGFLVFTNGSTIISPEKTGVISVTNTGKTGYTVTNVVLKGMTFNNMNTTNSGSILMVRNGSLTIEDCLFTGCTAGNSPFLNFYNNGVSRVIRGTTFSNCYSGYGIIGHNKAGDSLIENCEITGCTTAGGQFYASNPGEFHTITIRNLHIHDNFKSYGIYISTVDWVFDISGYTNGNASGIASYSTTPRYNIFNFRDYNKFGYLHFYTEATGIVRYITGSTTAFFTTNSSFSFGSDNKSVSAVGDYLVTNPKQFIVGGNATIITSTNSPVTISGIGAVIHFDGTNDFGSVYTVTASGGTESGSLYYGIKTATNPYVLIDYDAEATADVATAELDTDVTDRVVNFTAADGQTIVGGTFSIPTGSTVGVTVGKDADNVTQISASTVNGTVYPGSTVSISGGTPTISGNVRLNGTLAHGIAEIMTNVTISGSAGSVITSINDSSHAIYGTNFNMSGVSVSKTYIRLDKAGTSSISGCTIAVPDYGAIGASIGKLTVENCKFSGSSSWARIARYNGGPTFVLNNDIGGGQIDNYSGLFILKGNINLWRVCIVQDSTAIKYVFDGLNTFNATGKMFLSVTTNPAATTYLISGSTVDVSSHTTDEAVIIGCGVNGLKVGSFSDATNYSGTWTTGGTATIITSGGTYAVSGEGTYINSTLNPSGTTPEEKGTDLNVVQVTA